MRESIWVIQRKSDLRFLEITDGGRQLFHIRLFFAEKYYSEQDAQYLVNALGVDTFQTRRVEMVLQ